MNPAVIFVGNKTDLLENGKRGVPIEKAKDFAKQHDLKYFETSAKSGEGVFNAYHAMVNEIMEKRSSNPTPRSQKLQPGSGKKGFCNI